MEYISKKFAPGEDLTDAFAVRIAVFIDEQGFDPKLEIDAVDPLAHHIVLYHAGQPVATGRVFPRQEDGLYTIGRVAVLAQCRGGTGRLLMERLEALAGELGARCVTLGAQCRAREFYGKLGYESYGEEYYDEFCPHINMKKTLKKADAKTG